MGNALNNVNLGRFPSEFNPKIHGAYQADRFYGTPDKPFSSLKINEVVPWLNRRDMSVTGIGRFFSRKLYTHQRKYYLSAGNRGIGIVHFALLFAFVGFVRSYQHDRHLDDGKYH
ncbi:putative ATP synthase subunit f, mitochondrial [Crassostrea virginica]|uniref:ATP synthase subunit f, mitochondrial n=1 Tax=Crassostrea virginica TaxID=6565 RepID=A0A8B8CLV0_CRAVI|nr:putative ATP synthase subunit f, mitochondrial [Crassostrea virginica]XP_022318190.1 putative ATP synthase subunit f, mitochondrial [Crassostrea virginica]